MVDGRPEVEVGVAVFEPPETEEGTEADVAVGVEVALRVPRPFLIGAPTGPRTGAGADVPGSAVAVERVMRVAGAGAAPGMVGTGLGLGLRPMVGGKKRTDREGAKR